MNKYVVSRELAEKLKAAGYKPKFINFYYYDDVLDYNRNGYLLQDPKVIAAPLSDELLEVLPLSIQHETENHLHERSLQIWIDKQGVHAGYKGIKHITADKPADALAELWLWAHENGYIKEGK